MSKLGCVCGATIYDQTDNLPYKGQIIRDQHYDELFVNLAHDIAQFIEVKGEGSQKEWLAKHFTKEYSELRLDTEEVVADLISAFLLRVALAIYQCENCGRIWIQDQEETNKFRAFQPDGDDWQGSLAVTKQETRDPDKPV